MGRERSAAPLGPGALLQRRIALELFTVIDVDRLVRPVWNRMDQPEPGLRCEDPPLQAGLLIPDDFLRILDGESALC